MKSISEDSSNAQVPTGEPEKIPGYVKRKIRERKTSKERPTVARARVKRHRLLTNTEAQREAFLLIRSFSKLANSDFPVGLFSLADRLSITPPGASCVISKLVEVGAIEKTANAKINSRSARYRWIATVEQPF